MLHVFSILDSRAELFGNPVFTVSLGGAIRSFEDEARNKESPIAQHPRDYELYHLGEFDPESGSFNLFDAPKRLCYATDFVKPQE
jgi:hypothetical protein